MSSPQSDPQAQTVYQRGMSWLRQQGVGQHHSVRFVECDAAEWQGIDSVAPPPRWWMLTARQGRITYALYITLRADGDYGVIGEMAESEAAA